MVRAVALLGVAGLVVAIAATNISTAGSSVTATVKTFLLDWEQQDYTDAAAMTTGQPAEVKDDLGAVYRQLGAEDLGLSMGQVTVRGDQAQASFYASFDLGRGGLTWRYTGRFTLERGSSGWRVLWKPSVIVPGLGVGDRLAVLTTIHQRAVLLDSQGHSLIGRSQVIELGVVPDHVRDPLRTAKRLARVTGLAQSDADEMSGQIEAWPPRKFLELIQLTPASYRHLRRALARVPDLMHKSRIERLFTSAAPVVTGQVATETARTLVEDGEPYRPGTTIGLTGLQQAFQAKLAGKPETEVVVQNSAGKRIRILHEWIGKSGSNIRTTISGPVQRAADNALKGMGLSASIVAVQAGGGQILAVARHTAHGIPTVNPLGGQYEPGQTFTIVSAAALLAARSVHVQTKVKCYPTNPVGLQTFSNVPAEHHLGSEPRFSEVFAHACSTAFAVLSLRLTARQLTDQAQALGISGVPWKLPLAAFPGTMTSPGQNQGELAADTVGTGTVRVNPLDMALVAGAVDSGSWRAPVLVAGPSTERPAKSGLSPSVASQLRELMRITVKSGAAKAADRPGVALYGQVGTASLPGHRHLRAIWFVGFRGNVAFSVLVFARSTAFAPAVQIAREFAAGLPKT